MNQNTLRPDLSRPETKAKFFASHYGQLIVMNDDSNPVDEPYSVDYLTLQHIEAHNKFLLLTSLSDITDEDLEAISFTIPDGTNDVEFDFQPDNYKFHWKAKKGIRIKEGYLALKDFDYLRSRGYALPWMGYSVDELIKAGYLVLKKGGK